MAKSEYIAWHKASYSDGTGNCVEVAGAGGLVAIRDTKQGGRGSMLEFGSAAWREFLTAIKNGNTKT